MNDRRNFIRKMGLGAAALLLSPRIGPTLPLEAHYPHRSLVSRREHRSNRPGPGSGVGEGLGSPRSGGEPHGGVEEL
jgi:hypothetical protein